MNTYTVNGRKITDLSFVEKLALVALILTKQDESLLIIKEIEGYEPFAIEDKASELPLIIQTMLTRGKQFADTETADIIKRAMKAIPDDLLTIQEKSAFIEKNYPQLKEFFINLAYAEPLPILEEQLKITKISLPEYQQAVKQALNYSDYIVLSLGLLRSIIKDDETKGILNIIEKNYLELNYEVCIGTIENLCFILKTRGNRDIVKACNSIISAKKMSVEVDPDRNNTRRFFENKFSQYALGHLKKTNNLSAIENITQYFLGMNIDNVEEAEEAIGAVAEYLNDDIVKRYLELKVLSPKYLTKDRQLREGFKDSEDESMDADIGESTLSMNLGAMRSNAPNFPDEIADQTLRNRLPDIFRAPKDTKGYSVQNKRNRAAYISSISGHTFAILAMLETYVKAKQEKQDFETAEGNLELENDIKAFLLGYISTFMKRGYHSVHEVLDVIREPAIQKIFKDLKVNININSLIAPEIVSMAMNDALAYSKTTHLKMAAQTEFMEHIKNKRNKDEKRKNIKHAENIKFALMDTLREFKANLWEKKSEFEAFLKDIHNPIPEEKLKAFVSYEIPHDILKKFEFLKKNQPDSSVVKQFEAYQKDLEKFKTNAAIILTDINPAYAAKPVLHSYHVGAKKQSPPTEEPTKPIPGKKA